MESVFGRHIKKLEKKCKKSYKIINLHQTFEIRRMITFFEGTHASFDVLGRHD